MNTMQDWPSRIADQLEQRRRATSSTETIRQEAPFTVASGISPSGPIHMGNLREVMTGAFVAEELRARGHAVRHILSWDDYDRFRKVPAGIAGVDDSWEEYIGMPLSEVPAPAGSASASWAEHFKEPFRTALSALQVEIEEISQTEEYGRGSYHHQVIWALDHREVLGSILAGYQTKDEMLVPEQYYPFKPYCRSCGRDTTKVTVWRSEDESLGYECICGNYGVDYLSNIAGKLVWKVDWPMRWAYEHVDFEPAGRDHMSPGSSWTVGGEIVGEMGNLQPLGQPYSFVGVDGQAKMASSRGGAPTPESLLPALGAEVIRWLYARVRPEQAFSIDVTNASRLMDEWDALQRKVQASSANAVELANWKRSTLLERSPDVLPQVKYSAWVSFADMTMGNREQMKALAEADGIRLTHADVERGELAAYWVEHFMEPSDRTHFSSSFQKEYYESLSSEHQGALQKLAEGLEEHWDELTRWTFGVPKLQYGYSLDERKLSPEAKNFQREYFQHVYQLLLGADRGPRLPSLIQCLGLERTQDLLGM